MGRNENPNKILEKKALKFTVIYFKTYQFN